MAEPETKKKRKVKLNSRGGVAVDKKEIRQAFDFFDTIQRGYITIADLKQRLPIFYKSLTPREYKFLMNGKDKICVDDLYDWLVDNELKNFDPVGEAFKIFDPNDTGYMDTEVLKAVFTRLGFGQISDQDIDILIRTADCDEDGRISCEDFRSMLGRATPR